MCVCVCFAVNALFSLIFCLNILSNPGFISQLTSPMPQSKRTLLCLAFNCAVVVFTLHPRVSEKETETVDICLTFE